MKLFRSLSIVLVVLLTALLSAQTATEGDVLLRDFHFKSGEALAELKVHYRTFGSPRRDAAGMVRNAVLILHGTTGSGAQFLRPEFAGELFGAGQPLDAARFFIVLPDGIGHGQSSQAQRRPARPLPALRLPRHGGGPVPAADRRASA